MQSLGEHKGYQLVHTEMTGNNAFFVRTDLASGFGEPAAVPRSPNFFLRGLGHAPDKHRRRFVDLDAG